MNYVELEEVVADKKFSEEDKERLAKRYREITEEELNEMHKDKTTYIDDDHPAWIAYQKAKNEKSISLSDALQQLIDETED
jgi:macrodomain Ter protein organizer (MatP/YcbG family)